MTMSMDKRIMPILFKKCSLDDEFIPFNDWLKKFNKARKIRVRKQWISQDKKCFYCQRELVEERNKKNSYTFDHKIPVSKGGTEHPSNILVACKKCNGSKSNMPFDEFHKIVYDEQSYNEFIKQQNILRQERIRIRKENIINGILTERQLKLCFTFIFMEKMGLINIDTIIKNLIKVDEVIKQINKKGIKERRREKRNFVFSITS